MTARYLVRQVRLGKRQEGALKLHNFADPIKFSGNLALAKNAQLRVPHPATPVVSSTSPPTGQIADGTLTAAKLADFRKNFGRR